MNTHSDMYIKYVYLYHYKTSSQKGKFSRIIKIWQIQFPSGTSVIHHIHPTLEATGLAQLCNSKASCSCTLPRCPSLLQPPKYRKHYATINITKGVCSQMRHNFTDAGLSTRLSDSWGSYTRIFSLCFKMSNIKKCSSVCTTNAHVLANRNIFF